MKTKLATAGLLIGALLFPVVGYTAEKAPAGRSDQPVEDTVITTTIKALFIKDKEVSFRNIEVKTVNGVVHLSGIAKSKQESDKAVSMARDVKGVQSVKNDIQVSAKPIASAREQMSDKDRPATTRRSDQPVDDSVITTKVKSLFVKDKYVRARNIEVKTVNGVVELSGTARSAQESSRAASIARKVKGVKSVKNDLQVSAKPTASAREKMSDKDRPATTRRSDHPVDDSVITTTLKTRFVKDKQVRARNIEVKTVNGVVELSGTAGSKQEASRAASIARNVNGVKSVKNDIQVLAKPTAADREKMSDKDRPATTRRSDQPVADSVITTKIKALFVKDKEVSFRNIEVKTVNGVVHLSGIAKSKQESDKAVSMARDVTGVNSVRNDIRVQ